MRTANRGIGIARDEIDGGRSRRPQVAARKSDRAGYGEEFSVRDRRETKRTGVIQRCVGKLRIGRGVDRVD